MYRLQQYPSEHFIYTLHVYPYRSVVTVVYNSNIQLKYLLQEGKRKLGLPNVYVSKITEL